MAGVALLAPGHVLGRGWSVTLRSCVWQAWHLVTFATLSYTPLSHNQSSTISTQLTHTFSHTTCSHTTFSQATLSHTQVSHTYLFHTICLPPSPKNSHILFQIHSINLLTQNSRTRSVFHHLLSLSCLSHPVFTFLLRLTGRS